MESLFKMWKELGLLTLITLSCNSNVDNSEGMIQQGYSYGSKSGKAAVFAPNPAWIKTACPHCGKIVYADTVNHKFYHENPVCPEFTKEHEKQRRGDDILIKN
jgi:hypothetical protein